MFCTDVLTVLEIRYTAVFRAEGDHGATLDFYLYSHRKYISCKLDKMISITKIC